MDPRLDTDGWLTLTETHYWISTDRDLHPARCAELSSARERAGHRRRFFAVRWTGLVMCLLIFVVAKFPRQ